MEKQKPHFKVEFIPHPATWLNGRRWEDAIPTQAEGQEAKPTNQPETAIDYTKPQNLIKPIIYEYDPEERARQSAEMKRIRKEQ